MKIRLNRSNGMSLIEMTIVVAITSVVLLVVYGMMDDAARTALFVESHNDLPVFSQAAVNTVQRQVFQARQIFQDIAADRAYMAALAIDPTIPVQANTVLPLINEGGTLIPDTGRGVAPACVPAGACRAVGNCLLIAKQYPPIELTLASVPPRTFVADRYRFHYFYLTRSAKRTFSRTPYFLNVVQAQSEMYADYYQLNSLSAADLMLVTPQLLANGIKPEERLAAGEQITRAWNPGGTLTTSFYNVSGGADGTFANNAPLGMGGTSIPIRKTGSLIPGIIGGRISGRLDYTVGFRPSPTTQFPVPALVPKYAIVDPGLPSFPSGFEVLIVGPPGAHSVLTRLVLMAQYGANKMDSHEVVVVTSAR